MANNPLDGHRRFRPAHTVTAGVFSPPGRAPTALALRCSLLGVGCWQQRRRGSWGRALHRRTGSRSIGRFGPRPLSETVRLPVGGDIRSGFRSEYPKRRPIPKGGGVAGIQRLKDHHPILVAARRALAAASFTGDPVFSLGCSAEDAGSRPAAVGCWVCTATCEAWHHGPAKQI